MMRLRYILMFFTLMGAAACAAFGVKEYSLSSQSSQEPEEISLRDLIKRGREGNPNILLKDFTILEDYIYQKKRLSSEWTKVWVPIVPTDAEEDAGGKPAAIQAFLYSEDVGSEKEVLKRFDKPRLRGLLTPHAPKPGLISSVFIKRRLGTEPGQCLIIEEGREPAGVLKLTLYSLGCVLLIFLTGGIWYLAREFDKIEVEPKPADTNHSVRRNYERGSERILDAEPVLDADRILDAEPVLDVEPVRNVQPRPPLS